MAETEQPETSELVNEIMALPVEQPARVALAYLRGLEDGIEIGSLPPARFSPDRQRRPRKNLKRVIGTNGYALRWVGKGHHLADSKGYAYEHRLAAEDKLGRQLLPGEVVHHINGDRLDNGPENLEVYAGHHEHNVNHRTTNFGLRMPGEPNPVVPCACGCGQAFERYDADGRPRRYVSGHNPQATPIRDAVATLIATAAFPVSAPFVAASTGQTVEAAATSLARLVKRGEAVRVRRGLYFRPDAGA